MIPVMPAATAAYYDAVYAKMVQNDAILSMTEYPAKYAAPHCVGSVLDVGCGLGRLANLLPGHEVLGIDISPFIVQWATAHTTNPLARFETGDILTGDWGRFDTVALVETLEHVDSPAAVMAIARTMARQRIVVTVPVNMSDESHVWPTWTQADLQTLMPGCSVQQILGGQQWLAVEVVA